MAREKRKITPEDYVRVMFAFRESISEMYERYKAGKKPRTNVISYARQYLHNVAPHISREELCRMFNMSFSDLSKEMGVDVGEIK